MAKYAVQVFVNRKYITIVESVKATADHLSNVMDKFTAFNRTGDTKYIATGVGVESLADRATRLVRIPTDGAKPVVLRKSRTVAEKIAA